MDQQTRNLVLPQVKISRFLPPSLKQAMHRMSRQQDPAELEQTLARQPCVALARLRDPWAFARRFILAFYTGAGETALEVGRSSLDAYATELDSVMQVDGATILSGFIGGGIGAMAGAKFRRGLANDLSGEVEMMRGTRKVTTEVDLGGGVKAKVIIDRHGKPVVTEGAEPQTNWFKGKNGVHVVGDVVVVNPRVIAKRFRDGTRNAPALTANELMEYEIAKAGSLSRLLKTFLKDESGALDPKMERGEKPFVIRDAEGNAQPNMEAISEARAKSGTITLGPEGGPNAKGRIKGVRVRASATKLRHRRIARSAITQSGKRKRTQKKPLKPTAPRTTASRKTGKWKLSPD